MKDAPEIEQTIIATQVMCDENGNPMDYIVGKNCSRIEICPKAAEYCYVPYVRVWGGDNCILEFCQHKATFVRFGPK